MADANDGGSKELSFPKNKIKVLLLEAIHLQALADFEVRRCPGWAVIFHLSRGLFIYVSTFWLAGDGCSVGGQAGACLVVWALRYISHCDGDGRLGPRAGWEVGDVFKGCNALGLFLRWRG